MADTQKLITQSDDHSILGAQNLQKQTITTKSKFKVTNPKAQSLIGLITHSIQDKIQNNQINISEQTKPFEINENHNHSVLKLDNQKMSQKKIAEIVKKRNKLEEQMGYLKLQQEEQKQKNRSRSPLEQSHTKNFRSYYTEKQQMQISRIMKQSQQFQQNLQAKNKQIALQQQQQKRRQVQQQRIHLQRQKQKKKQQARRSIQKQHQQQKQRLQRLKQQNKKYQQVKNGKALHEKIEQFQKNLEQLKQSKQKQILIKKRKQMMFDIEEIKKHQQRYYQSIKLQKQKMQRQKAQKIRLMKQKERQIAQAHKNSKFLNTLFLQQKRKQQQNDQKVRKIKNLFQRRNSYQQKLRQLHKDLMKSKPKPKIQKSEVQVKSQERRLKAKSLSAADIYKQGQQYMKQIHSQISPVEVEQSKVQLEQNYKSLRQGQKIQYRDYLKESKVKRQTFFKSHGRLNSNPQISQLRAIISSKDHNATDKLFKAKLIAQKLDEKAKNSTTRTMVNSIAAKLKIIQQFS